MIDTIKLVITPNEVNRIDFVRDIYPNIKLTNVDTGEERITGNLGNLRIRLRRDSLRAEGSLSKWYLGNNYQTISREQIKQAIEQLSEELTLPMERANVRRLDFGVTMPVKWPVAAYLNHLGTLRYADRCMQPSGLYYNLASEKKILYFYDKVKESKKHREKIPEDYQNNNYLRYEYRYKNPHKFLKRQELTAADLCREEIINTLIDHWQSEYKSINKINDVNMKNDKVKTIRQFYKAGIVALCEKIGGEIVMLDRIKEWQMCKKISNKQAYDLRQAVKEAHADESMLTATSEAIEELNNTISQTGEYLRETML